MVISFEEKYRKRIEETGMTVIQVKRVFYRFIDLVRDAMKVVKKYYNSLSSEQKAEILKSININEDCQQGYTDNFYRNVVPP